MSSLLVKMIGLVLLSLIVFISRIEALAYSWPKNNDQVIGVLQEISLKKEITWNQLAWDQDVPLENLLRANRGKTLEDILLLPTAMILPSGLKEGIVINLPETRLYFFDTKHQIVFVFPVGLGKNNTVTPLLKTQVTAKIKNPVWHVPLSILKEKEEQGIYFPREVPAGENNPLGDYAFKLRGTTVMIHSTNRPFSVGKYESAGCIRLYPEDMKLLFSLVSVGTPVRIIHQPIKFGWLDHSLYVEVHPSLLENSQEMTVFQPNNIFDELSRFYSENLLVHMNLLSQLAEEKNGLPIPILFK